MKGIYALSMVLDKDISINVGALGKTTLTKGTYAYIGSAQSNLEKRVQRHIRKKKKLFWHIDYLLDSENTKITNVFYLNEGKTEECKIAQELSKVGAPIKGFGCSDCHCASHLFRLRNSESLRNLMNELKL